MPPPRSRPPPDDSRSEASSTKEKINTTAANNHNGKGRRLGSTAVAGSSLRDVVTAGQSTAVASGSGNATSDANPGIQWTSFGDAVLHGYRYDYRLNTPAAFNKPYNQMILSQSPLGRISPTMARQKQQRRQSKPQLATTVRKHFNGMGVTETDVIVDFLYKVRWQDKNFRMRFTPPRPR